MKKIFQAKGSAAARLRQRKYELVRKYQIPQDLLPGSLSLVHRKCGKPTCWCAKEAGGHPLWLLSFMVSGKNRVERIPDSWVEEVQRLVNAGREFKQAVSEVLAANAQLLVLYRREEQKRKKRGH